MELNKSMKKPKLKKLSSIFVRYIAIFCGVTLLLVLLLVMFLTVMFSNNFILPANDSSIRIMNRKEEIAESERVTPDLLPDTSRYVVFSTSGELLYGNMDKGEATRAWRMMQEGSHQYFLYFYLSIPRQNEICMIRYTFMAQFASPELRKYLPPPEILFYGMFIVGFLLEVLFLSSLFGKKLIYKLDSLQNATEKIQNQDLDFSVGSSGVVEIDNVLHSIDKMKEALKISLKKQWDMEQSRREQMSALAHDIKTPVTVVRGNVDLLIETKITEEQKEYIGYIKESASQMEQYIKTLIEISKAEVENSMCKNLIDSALFINSIQGPIRALAASKKLTLHFVESRDIPKLFYADSDLLQRAILNIVSNAVEFSSENSQINFDMKAKEHMLRFCVTDYGKGFSAEEIKQAHQQFYMGDKSRSSKLHYGMGLFIADSIVIQHGGRLLIENSEITGGGKVTIEIPM